MTLAMDASKYDPICAQVRRETQADVVMLIVVGGPNGSGYSLKAVEAIAESGEFAKEAPRLLRELADHLEGVEGSPLRPMH